MLTILTHGVTFSTGCMFGILFCLFFHTNVYILKMRLGVNTIKMVYKLAMMSLDIMNIETKTNTWYSKTKRAGSIILFGIRYCCQKRPKHSQKQQQDQHKHHCNHGDSFLKLRPPMQPLSSRFSLA